MNKALVILIPGFAANETDSTCLPMQQEFVRTLVRLYPNIEIIVIAFQYPFMRAEYDFFGARVISFGGRNNGNINRWLLHNKILSKLNKLSHENKIIGLLSFWLGECALVGQKFAHRNKLKHKCWIMGQDAKAGNKYLKRISPKPADLIALSDSLADELEKNYDFRPAKVIPPGIAVTDHIANNRDIDLLAVGSLIPLKSFDVFVEVVNRIKKQLPSVNAVVVGEGPERKYLENMVAKLNLQDSIRLKGQLSHEDVIKLMCRSKLLLHTSSYEGFPGVCNEALSAGTKVVSFVRAMQEEIENWYIVRTKEEMIKNAIEILRSKDTEYKQVIYQSMEKTAVKVMQSFLPPV